MLSKQFVLLGSLAVLLAGCGDKPVATVRNGECKAFQRAAVEACGVTLEDQDVLDDYVETGVSACKWLRPAPRTPTCADIRVEIAELRQFKTTALAGGAFPIVTAPPPKPTLRQRARKFLRGSQP